MEECINKKQTGNIISAAEALRFLPSYIHSLGLEANKRIKMSSDPVSLSEIKSLSLPQMPVLKDLAPQTLDTLSLAPAKMFDLNQFYLDEGPPGGWDAAASEHTRKLAMGKGEEHQGGRVIKERREEEGRTETLRFPTYGKTSSRTGTLGKVGRTGTLGKGGASERSGNPNKGANSTRKASPMDKRSPGGGKKQAGKEDKVTGQINKPGSNRKTNSSVPVQEVSFSPRLETNPEEEEGPFRFQAMLRRTNVLPTDSLRRRRGGPPKPMGEEVLRLFGGSLMPPLIAPTAAEVVL